MKKIFVMLIFIFCYAYEGFSQDTISIKIISKEPVKSKITPLLFGNFFEFLNDFINGDYGLWAQELYNRGFDLAEGNSPDNWKTFVKPEFPEDSVTICSGGYNPNGKYYLRIKNNNINSASGLFQNVYVYDTVGGLFYVYLKSGTSPGKVFLQFSDTSSKEIFFQEEIIGITDRWTKFSINTQPVWQKHRINLTIVMEGNGELDLDEASFMPQNNLMGIKNDYFQLFKDWKPGILIIASNK